MDTNTTTQTVTGIMQTVDQWTSYALSLGAGPFTVFAGWVVGWVIKLLPFVPNNRIPLCVVTWCAICYPLLATRGATPWRVFIVQSVVLGLGMGLAAWWTHNKILSRFENRLPGLGRMLVKAEETNQPKEQP